MEISGRGINLSARDEPVNRYASNFRISHSLFLSLSKSSTSNITFLYFAVKGFGIGAVKNAHRSACYVAGILSMLQLSPNNGRCSPTFLPRHFRVAIYCHCTKPASYTLCYSGTPFWKVLNMWTNALP